MSRIKSNKGPSKRGFARGSYKAESLGSVQDPNQKKAHFKQRPCNKQNHAWMKGSVAYVCSICGRTKPLVEERLNLEDFLNV
jgi:hypothetical protein